MQNHIMHHLYRQGNVSCSGIGMGGASRALQESGTLMEYDYKYFKICSHSVAVAEKLDGLKKFEKTNR